MDGLILTGDAAGQLIPMTGAGIHCSIQSGKMAGRAAVEAIRKGDVSEERLSAYRTEFDEYWGKRIIEAGKVLYMLDKFSDEDLNVLAEVISHEDIMHMANGLNVASAMASLVKKSPLKLMQLIKVFLR
jgi:digeranylgeranylglycerophospholipid reductase